MAYLRVITVERFVESGKRGQKKWDVGKER